MNASYMAAEADGVGMGNTGHDGTGSIQDNDWELGSS